MYCSIVIDRQFNLRLFWIPYISKSVIYMVFLWIAWIWINNINLVKLHNSYLILVNFLKLVIQDNIGIFRVLVDQ